MGSLARDARYAVRTLLKQPGFTAVAVLILALGIGVNTSIFGMINALLLSAPRGVQAPAELVRVNRVDSQRSLDGTTYPDYAYFRDENRVFTGLAAYAADATPLMLRAGDAVEQIDGTFVSGNFFTVLGVRPAAGRGFVATEDGPAATERAAVISHRLWERHFGGAPTAVGQVITLNGKPFTVVGVAPAEFRGAGLDDEPVDVWVPIWSQPRLLGRAEDELRRRENYVWTWLTVVGRLKPGVTVDEARTNISALAAQLGREYKDNAQVGAALTADFALDPARRTALVSMARLVAGIALMVLLIACANLANLLLARASARRREVGVRRAFGATRGDIVRQLLTESVLLALAGAFGGLLVAAWTTDAIIGLLPYTLIADVRPDARVVGAAVVLALLTGVLAGVVPALRSSDVELTPELKRGGAAIEGRSRLRSALVVVQVALSFMLLVGSGLFVRSVQRVRNVALGFETTGGLAASLDLRPYGYDSVTGPAFYRRLLERASALPGVRSATYGYIVPLSGASMSGSLNVEGVESSNDGDASAMAAAALAAAQGKPNPQGPPMVSFNIVGPNYFRTLGIPLLRGRDFTERDDERAPAVVVVNETFARRYWPKQDPIGKRVRRGPDTPWLQVVGVARDGRYYRATDEPEPYVFIPYLQRPEPQMRLQLRTDGDPALLAPRVRELVRELDPNVTVGTMRTMEEVFGRSVRRFTTNAMLVGALGTLALLLAAVGLYGVMAYAVAQRTREIGLRMALGARSGDVLRRVTGQGARLALVGMALGAGGAYALSRLLERFLYGVTAKDAPAFALAAAVLGAAALLASYIPARRASRVDPMVALRAE